ncbi:MAG: isoprenylcysteine carboxylmethyltransferase family protein [bacterium]|nr:isoprenylcysteine carboxylmethyltransferase family protein [bacterium]
MNFTLFYIAFLFLSLIYRQMRRSATSRNKEEKGVIYSKSIYPIQFILYMVLFIGCAIEYLLFRRRVNLAICSTGFIMYFFGIFNREWVIKSLGKYWSHYIEIKKDHRLIKEGPYRYVRHPHLLCLLIEMTGLALIPNSYYSLLLIWLIYLPITLWRIYLEEKALIEKFGKEYIEYKKEVYALLPLNFIKGVLAKGRDYR